MYKQISDFVRCAELAKRAFPILKDIQKNRGATVVDVLVPFTDGKRQIGVGVNLEKAIQNPEDLDARGKLLIASTLAGMALDGAGAGLAHSIGHALGTIGGIHHGRAVALALDVIFEKNATTAIDAHTEIAAALGIAPGTAPPEVLAKRGAQAFSDFIRRTGIAISLKEDGLSTDDVERLIDVIHSAENTPMSKNNCYTASKEDIREFARQLLSP